MLEVLNPQFDKMISSFGTLCYRKESLVVEVSKDLAKLYQFLLSKEIEKYNIPLFDPHITIIRKGEILTPIDIDQHEIEFFYYPYIDFHDEYYFIPIDKKNLETIRVNYGLDWCFDKEKGFHITIANIKNIKC